MRMYAARGIPLALAALALPLLITAGAHAASPKGEGKLKEDPFKELERLRIPQKSKIPPRALSAKSPLDATGKPPFPEGYTDIEGCSVAKFDCNTGRVWLASISHRRGEESHAVAVFKNPAPLLDGGGAGKASVTAKFRVQKMYCSGQQLNAILVVYKDGFCVEQLTKSAGLNAPDSVTLQTDEFAIEARATYHAEARLHTNTTSRLSLTDGVMVNDAEVEFIRWNRVGAKPAR